MRYKREDHEIWFAWYPIVTVCGTVVWWEKVIRTNGVTVTSYRLLKENNNSRSKSKERND